MKTINPMISESLSKLNIPYNDGIAYLLSIYYEVIPSYIPPVIQQKINMTGILSYSSSGLVWNEPLFINDEVDVDKWNWVITDFMSMFEKVNSKRKGTKSTCIARMKSFFAKNPEVRKEDVLGATKMYIESVSNPEYLITSHYFIFKDKGPDRTSGLEEWIDKYLAVIANVPVSQGHITNTMQMGR